MSKANIDDLVTATAPIADVNSEGKVTAVTKQPVTAETIEAYRSDVIEASRLEPQGGAPSDYRLWASEVTEVRTVYPYVKEGNPGDIEIFIEATEENTAPAEIIGVPTQETIDKVYKRVEDSEEKIQEFMSIHEKIEALTKRTNKVEKLLIDQHSEINLLKKKK